MRKEKICMLGASGAGKTSLVAHFVVSIFSDSYHSNLGVKIDKKIVTVDGEEVTLMIWDIAEEEDSASLRLNQVRDASGYLLVAEGTRRSVEIARRIQQRMQAEVGALPFLLLVNKADLRERTDMPGSEWQKLADAGWTIFETSAKSGQHVEEAFLTLTSRILARAR